MPPVAATEARALAASLIPPLSRTGHKGSSGRVAILGGSVDYCGAPYFAAATALRCGADLAYVLCPPEAAAAVKAYSPDIVVRPLLCPERAADLHAVLRRCHAVVVGPGINDCAVTRGSVLPAAVAAARAAGVPVVVDTDVMCHPALLATVRAAGPPCVLTPNIRELALLAAAVGSPLPPGTAAVAAEDVPRVAAAVSAATGAAIAAKAPDDLVVAGATVVPAVGSAGSPRRAAGQGDLVAGAVGCFAAWCCIAGRLDDGPTVACAASAGTAVVRGAAAAAFQQHGRSMLASDALLAVPAAFQQLFPDPPAKL